ncbi:hypothetical protein DASC09_039740 [Saccharomycopsis crataegensis]|uniref:WIBG Mago-binding domain-containing protein n=1 Tax=Saccharomycopsis crataegensis TaxID=43959 RepID=A0AAV5QPP5_9ASCO|nr:hypothetical protein DASC09_039740 [Saccharomycopsis crataegensis]
MDGWWGDDSNNNDTIGGTLRADDTRRKVVKIRPGFAAPEARQRYSVRELMERKQRQKEGNLQRVSDRKVPLDSNYSQRSTKNTSVSGHGGSEVDEDLSQTLAGIDINNVRGTKVERSQKASLPSSSKAEDRKRSLIIHERDPKSKQFSEDTKKTNDENKKSTKHYKQRKKKMTLEELEKQYNKTEK